MIKSASSYMASNRLPQIPQPELSVWIEGTCWATLTQAGSPGLQDLLVGESREKLGMGELTSFCT